jgi:hypothetical protein
VSCCPVWRASAHGSNGITAPGQSANTVAFDIFGGFYGAWKFIYTKDWQRPVGECCKVEVKYILKKWRVKIPAISFKKLSIKLY